MLPYTYNYSADFYSGLRAVIEQGGDADTNGAVTGALLGIKFGFKGLPEELVNNLIEKERLKEKAKSFIKLIV